METTAQKRVPVFTSLQEVYLDTDNSVRDVHEPRLKNLKDRFKGTYGCLPQFYARAPGRVNIIGEHIDYCGYSVLPAALEQDFLMAYVAVDDGQEGADEIAIANIDKDSYAPVTITTDPFQKLRETADWLNYFLCGYKAILAHDDGVRAQLTGKPKGLKILIDSVVPAAAGLSSSSAFTVCAAVCTMHANGLTDKISQQQLADLTINAERAAGTACGGMDQTISIMGEKGTATMIDFVPSIATTAVAIPDSVCLVIGNSCTPSPKLLTLGTRYNKRVVECRFGVAAMSLKAGKAKSFESCPFTTFEQLQTALGYTFAQMLDLLKESFTSKEQYTPQKIAREFDVDDPFEIVKDIPHVYEVKSQNAGFDLYKRAYHVLTEAHRVHEFKRICGEKDLNEDTQVQQLGKLMNESQHSCNLYYDCSSPQLEELTQLARDSGALGSRLTGAGWGGCSVSLVKKDILEEFITAMYPYYTKDRPVGDQLWITDDLNRYLFATKPGQGACVIDPSVALWAM